MRSKQVKEAIDNIVFKKENPRVVVGVDPDSDKNGIALYVNDELEHLFCADTLELFDFLKSIKMHCSKLLCSIEDLRSNSSSSFKHKAVQSQAIKSKISERVGMCKQAQNEVEKVCIKLDVDMIHQKVSSKWKKGERQLKEFKSVTKWRSKSNPDTRSAAYLGFIVIGGKR